MALPHIGVAIVTGDLILHHYPGSPYAEKIRSILGFNGLAWSSVDFLESHAPTPSLFPTGSRGLCDLMANWAELRVFLSTDPVRLQTSEDVAGVFGGRVDVVRFVEDRTLFMRPALDVPQASTLLPAAMDLAGRVVNHFPRIGFRVLPAEGRRHFAGDIRPR
jgi:hypothetical protein